MLYIAFISFCQKMKREKNRVGKATEKIHTGVTIPYAWLVDMQLTGDKYSRTCDMTYDNVNKVIIIKKAEM